MEYTIPPFRFDVPPGPKGDKGDKGDPGMAPAELASILSRLSALEAGAPPPEPEPEPIPEPAPATGTQARSAFSFADSIGVNTHMHYPAYDSRFSQILGLLRDSGIRHIRDAGQYTTPSASKYQQIGQAGIRIMLNCDQQSNFITGVPGPFPKGIGGMLDWISTFVSAVDLLEGPNESDTGGSKTVPIGVQFCKDLRAAYKARPSLAHLPLVALSFTQAGSSDQCAGQLAGVVDYNNCHPYTAYPPPSAPSAQHFLAEIANRKKPAPAVPMIASESGYPTGSSTRAVSPAVQAKYLLRQFALSYALGIIRNYSYELVDEGTNAADPEQTFGIISNSGAPKPAYSALRSLLSLLSDPAGAGFAPGKLDLQIGFQGGQWFLLQKSSGEFWVVAWLDGMSTDGDRMAPAQLSIPQGKTATWYAPSQGTAPVVPGAVRDSLTLIRIA